MRMEMEGKEPLIVLFGVPLLTAGIVLASMYFGHINTRVVPPPDVNTTVEVNPRVTAELPQGSIRITNQVPPAQIHEYKVPEVKVPEVNITNRVEPGKPPDVYFSMPHSGKESETRIIAVPSPVPMMLPTPVTADPPEGKLLPPPKTYVPATPVPAPR